MDTQGTIACLIVHGELYVIENLDDAIVVWMLRNREDGRVVTVTRKAEEPAPCDSQWEVITVYYIDVEASRF